MMIISTSAARSRRGAGSSKRHFVLPLLALLSCNASADDGGVLSEAAWSAAIPKVYFATRQEQSVATAPISVTVINREMIDAQGATNVAEILHLVPGLQVFYSNGATFGVTPHGFSDRYPKRLEVRVDGRSVYLPQLSSVAWESLGLLPEDIDHIEVIRGSNVPAYGSNAIMGAINIVTRNAVQSRGGSVGVTSGSAGTRVVGVRQQLSLETMDILLRAGHKQTDGFKALNDDAGINHLVLGSVSTPDLSNTLEVEFGYSDAKLGIGDGDHPDEFADESRRATWVNASWQHVNDKQLWKLRFSFSDYKFDRTRQQYLSEVLGVPPEYIPLLVAGHVDERIELAEGKRDFYVGNLELEHHLTFGQRRLIWGIGTRLDSMKNQQYFAGEVDAVVYYAFTNLEWQLSPRLDFNAGLMLEDKEGYKTDFSPRLAWNYHINDNHHLRASLTRAYRQPALQESDLEWTIRFANGDLLDLVETSHPDIQPGRVDSIELGYVGWGFDGRLGVDLKLFRETVKDEIDSFDVEETNCTDPLPDQLQLAQKYCPDFYVDGQYGAPLDKRVRVFSNTANWYVSGVEAQLVYKANSNSWLRFNYAWLRSHGRRDRRLHRSGYIENMGEFQPEHTAGLLYSYRAAANWKFSGHWRFTDFVDWRSGTNTKSYSRLDLKVGNTWQLGGNEAELAFTLQNALNREYIEFQNGNEFGRRGFVSLAISWP